MNEMIYQKIFDEIQDDIPDTWNKIIFLATYTDGSYSMKYYFTDGVKFTDCFSIPGLKMEELLKKFLKIDKILSEDRLKYAMDKRWSVMTMVINSDGKVNVDYEYDDLSETMISYEENWKKRYLQ